MKERDIRPEGLFEQFHIRNEADTRRFFPNGQNLEHFSCPGCGEDTYTELYRENSFSIVKCGICASSFVSPRPTEEALARFYREATSQKFLADVWYPSTAEGRLEKLIRPRARLITELAETHDINLGRVTDIGAGYGLLLDALREISPGTEFAAVEPNPPFVTKLKAQGYDVFDGLASDAAKNEKWMDSSDLVTAFEVFEHIHSPYAFLQEMKALAKPGGTVMFTGVNGNGLDILALGPVANAICPPQHLNFLSCRGVSMLLERCGLEEISVTTPGVLDVDIVKNMFKDKPQSIQDPFLRHLLEETDETTLEKFQEFLTDSNLSSHMLVIARKPR